MIKQYKNFNIFKREPKAGEEVNPNAPGYDVTVSNKNVDGTYEKSTTVASLWLKEGQKGKYFSGQMKKTVANFPGYVIVSEVELDKVLKLAEAMQQKLHSPLGDGYPTDFEDPSSIPF